MLSGYADFEVSQAINDGEIYRFLAKPWDNLKIVVTLAQLFSYMIFISIIII